MGSPDNLFPSSCFNLAFHGQMLTVWPLCHRALQLAERDFSADPDFYRWRLTPPPLESSPFVLN